MAAFGFIFFIAIGSKIIAVAHGNTKADATGAMSIITSFVYLADAAFSGFTLVKD